MSLSDIASPVTIIPAAGRAVRLSERRNIKPLEDQCKAHRLKKLAAAEAVAKREIRIRHLRQALERIDARRANLDEKEARLRAELSEIEAINQSLERAQCAG